MKKMTTLALAAAFVVTVGASAFAFGPDHPGGMRGGMMQGQQMTEQQKADFKEYHQKRMTLEKEFLQKQVAAGTITQEQADQRLQRMQAHHEAILSGKGMEMKRPGEKMHRMAGPLTEQQKADKKVEHEKMMAIHKEFLQKQVAAGTVTQEQADQRIKWMEARHEARMNGAMGPMFKGPLTEQQKADLKSEHDQMMEVKKENLQKQVAAGTMTQEQADQRIKMMQERFEQRLNGENGGHQGHKGHMGPMMGPQ